MMMTGRTLLLLMTLTVASGGAAWGVHALLSAAADGGIDYGLDTNGNGKFEWLVVEAQVALPQAGTWDIYAELASASPPQGGSCGYGVRPPLPMAADVLSSAVDAYPIAYISERYFFPGGVQTVRMAFSGTDIARASVDGPYAVQARLSLGGIPYPTMRPIADPTYALVEWNYMTKAYSASDFEQPIRPAYFTGGYTDSAIDVDADGLADFLELRADVHVNLAGHYNVNGYLSKDNGTDVIRIVAYAYRDFNLTTTDASVFLRFRGDQIRQAGVDGPWDFSLTLYGPLEYAYSNATAGPIGTILPPQPAYYPETLCGVTSGYHAADFDATVELLRFTGRFEEVTPDQNGDGTYDALVIRAEVEVFLSAGFELSGVLRPVAASTDVAQAYGQTWLREGFQWAEFSFPGPEIRASGVDGPYQATLSIKPAAVRFDPTTTYITKTYHATDFDAGSTNRTHGYWIGSLTATPSGSGMAISVTVVRGPDMLAVVFQDTLLVTVTDSAGGVVGAFKDAVYLPTSGASESFAHAVDNLSAATYGISAVLGAPSQPVDTRTIVVSV